MNSYSYCDNGTKVSKLIAETHSYMVPLVWDTFLAAIAKKIAFWAIFGPQKRGFRVLASDKF